MNPPFTSPEFQTNYFTSNLPSTRTGQGLLPPTTDLFQNAVIRLWDPDIQPAIAQQWNLAVEHQFTNSTTLQVGYVGQHGTHLMVALPYLQKQLHADGTITLSPFLSGNPTLQSELSQISGTAAIGNMHSIDPLIYYLIADIVTAFGIETTFIVPETDIDVIAVNENELRGL